MEIKTTQHVMMYSGGIASWGATKRLLEYTNKENVTVIFCDTKMEDEDLYKFLDETEKDLGITIIRLSDGRDPWQVFFDRKYLGNSRIDPCSQQLKRWLVRSYVHKNFSPETTTIHLGYTFDEIHRLKRTRKFWEPYFVDAPLCQPPYVDKNQLFEDLKKANISVPRLYSMGFSHNNCGGFCIKAGQSHFRLLLEKLPERFNYHMEKEQEIRKILGDVTILRKMTNGVRKNYSLLDLKNDVIAGNYTEQNEWGGCGCFLPDEGDTDDSTK